MGFFDKITEAAKNAGDKANDLIETNKLNSRIKDENRTIDAMLKAIGQHYYDQYLAGGTLEPEVLEHCAGIDKSKAAISELQTKIAELKNSNEPAGAPAAAPVASGIICSACGTSNSPTSKFCEKCGAAVQVAPPVEAAPEFKFCANCGTKNTSATSFCGNCGTKL